MPSRLAAVSGLGFAPAVLIDLQRRTLFAMPGKTELGTGEPGLGHSGSFGQPRPGQVAFRRDENATKRHSGRTPPAFPVPGDDVSMLVPGFHHSPPRKKNAGVPGPPLGADTKSFADPVYSRGETFSTASFEEMTG